MKVQINTKFLYYLRPENAVYIGLICFFFLLLIAPIKIVNTLDTASVVYLISCILLFGCGTKLIRTKKKKDVVLNVDFNNKLINRIYKISFFLGTLGVVLKYIDLLFIRGMSFTNTSIDNFDIALENGSNLYSIVSAFFIFFAYVPFTLDMVFRDMHKLKIKIIAFLILLSTAVSSLLVGSRFAIITPLLYSIIIILYSGVVKFSLKWFLVTIFIGLLIFNIIGSLFLKRLEEMNMTGAMAIVAVNGGYADKVPAKRNFIRLMEKSEDKFYYPYLFAYSNICQYFTHAVFEFPSVKNYIDEKGKYFYGKATFSVLYKFVEKIFGDSNVEEEITKYNARPGIWSTFFFSWYLDFGWFGLPLIFLFGVFCKLIWWKLYARGNILYLPLIIFLFIILLFLLQLNFISGSGTYALFSFILLPRLVKIKYKFYTFSK